MSIPNHMILEAKRVVLLEAKSSVFSSVDEEKAYGAFMLAPLTYIRGDGKEWGISDRKKRFYWHRLQGWNKAQSARKAGYAESVAKGWSSARREKPGELAAISKHFHLDQVSPDYIKSNVLEIAKNARQARDRIAALALLAKMLNIYKQPASLKVMTAQFVMPTPPCPRCGYDHGEDKGFLKLP